MKYGKSAMAALGMATLLAFATPIVHADAGVGELTATPAHHDFGDVPEGETAQVTTVVQNTGSEAVEITNVRTS